MSDQPLLRDVIEPGIVRLTFNRPEKLNALSTPTIRALYAALAYIAADASVRERLLDRAMGPKASSVRPTA